MLLSPIISSRENPFYQNPHFEYERETLNDKEIIDNSVNWPISACYKVIELTQCCALSIGAALRPPAHRSYPLEEAANQHRWPLLRLLYLVLDILRRKEA